MLKKVEEQMAARREKFKKRKEEAEERAKAAESGEGAGEAMPMETETGTETETGASADMAAPPPNSDAQDDTSAWDNEDEDAALAKEVRACHSPTPPHTHHTPPLPSRCDVPLAR